MAVMRTRGAISQKQVGVDVDLAWANSAAAGTAQTATFAVSDAGLFKVVGYNPSTVTDLSVSVREVQTNLKGASRDAVVGATLTFPKNQTTALVVGNVSGSVKLVASNVTVLGASDAFTATFRVYEL
ncbi:MAG: hypothetical protein P4N59_17705 [Negativicutes bacterium]|nr:hypothetical protein [Negativicutes bacterium]